MSLVRYSPDDTRSVVLRHQQTLVLYDPHSRSVILREASPASSEPVASQICPYCKRPMHDDDTDAESVAPGLGHGHRARSVSPLAESGFVDQQYFRMLNSSVLAEGTDPHEARRIPRLKPEDTIESEGEAGLEEEAEEEEVDSSYPAGIKESAFSPGYFKRFFITERELGRGGKGVVLLVRHVLDGVSLGNFACKRVPVGNNHEWLEKVLIEVQLLQQLSHPNLVSYRHVWLENAQLTTFGPSVPCAFILQQYCNFGDLHHYILGSAKPPTNEALKERLRRKSRGQAAEAPSQSRYMPKRLPFEQIISFFRDIAQGLSYLHANGFIHRDLKPSNCLLHDTGRPGEQLHVLVSDFGEVQQENETRKSTGNTGTISYCAPEVLRRVSPGGEYENFTTKSDVFSLGMILHFICFGRLPYVGADTVNEENEDLDALREEISAWRGFKETGRLRSDLPERLYQSLQTLIHPDPNMRPSAEEILLGIEKGIESETHSPPMRRGASTAPIVTTEMEESRHLGFRRISPIADTPRSVTPEVDHNGAGPSSESRINGKSRSDHVSRAASTGSKKASKLSQASAPPLSPSREDSTEANGSWLILRPRAKPPAAPVTSTGINSDSTADDRWMDRSDAIGWLILGIKIATFFIKVVSLNQPCLPSAPRPSIFYPIILLATLDFAMPVLSLTVVLGIAHVVLLVMVRAFGNLCIY